ncbi:MAG: thioredoxin family protein [Acidobacteria bacterium]|nr:thioredoxin family protein [Acidobacteriota bacterium]
MSISLDQYQKLKDKTDRAKANADRAAGALERAAATGKPVFIDFTGYTCINCRWMEKKIFADKSVFRAFQERFVLAQLYTDGGEFAEGNQKLQIERFRTIALPYYVILAPDNTVLATHAGIVPTPAKFLAWLDHGTRLTALVEKSAN